MTTLNIFSGGGDREEGGRMIYAVVALRRRPVLVCVSDEEYVVDRALTALRRLRPEGVFEKALAQSAEELRERYLGEQEPSQDSPGTHTHTEWM